MGILLCQGAQFDGMGRKPGGWRGLGGVLPDRLAGRASVPASPNCAENKGDQGSRGRSPSHFKLPRQECASVAGREVLSVEAADKVHLVADFREGAGRQWHGAICLAFAVVDGQQHGIEVEAGPLVVVRALGCRHPSPFQPPFKGYPCFSGNLLHRNVYRRYRPPLGGGWRC